MKLPSNVTMALVLKLCEQRLRTTANPGVCLACGEVFDNACEPDAWMYRCMECGERGVCAPEELLIRAYPLLK